ncbi:hypothetical protein L7F22_014011 [Adiantum nelumboides]|nr:hypothetical protein [Adiantum nelumboides]
MLGALSKIEKLLDHGEKIELVVDKTENLRFQEDSFQHQGRQLRRKLWLQSVKIKLAMFSITFFFIPVMTSTKFEAPENWKQEMSLELALENAKHSVLDELGMFDGYDPKGYLDCYEEELELQGMPTE